MAQKIAFISALGGQGTSLAAAYTAKASAAAGHPTALVDTCGFGGTLACMLGVEGDTVMHLNDAALGECDIEDALTDCGEHLKLLPSGSFSERTLSPLSVEVRRVIESLSREYDVFADIPGGMEDIDRCIDTVGARLLGVLPHDNRALEAVISGQPPDEKCELMRYAADTAARIYGGRVPLDAGRSFRMPF